MKKTIFIIMFEYNLNNIFLDYLFENIKDKIINQLFDYNIKIFLFTTFDIKYKYDELNTITSIDILSSKLKELSNNYSINNNCIKKGLYNINKITLLCDYIIYIPCNCYIHKALNNKYLNNTIIFDDNSKLFILPSKYNTYFKNLIMLDTKYIQDIVYINISYIHTINITNFVCYKKIGYHYLNKIIGLDKIILNTIDNNIIDISNIGLLKYIKNLNIKIKKTNNIIAIIIIGQVRTFIMPRVYLSLKTFIIDKLDQQNIDYMLFFYLDNKMEYLWQDNINYSEYNINIYYIENIINKITTKYILTFYNIDTIIKEIPIINSSLTQTLQAYLLYKIYNKVQDYEKLNNINFKYIIKTRPDVNYHKYNNYTLNDLINCITINNCIIKDWDVFYIFPRHLSDIIIKLYYLIIYPRTEDVFNILKSKYIWDNNTISFKKDSIKTLNKHEYLSICAEINNIQVKYYKITELIRPNDINIKEYINYLNDNYFDIIIPLGENDIDIIEQQLKYTIKNVIAYRKIYIICNDQIKSNILDSQYYTSNCIFISEEIFPFNKITIAKYHTKLSRNGWYLQQLIKLYAGIVIPGILKRYLVIDSDTFFLKPISFIENNKCLYNYGEQYHKPYFIHMKKLHPSLTKMIHDISGICHHMIFETKYIYELFSLIEKYHNKLFYIVFLENVIHYNGSGASEYEMYFNYMLKYNSSKIKLRKLNWANVSTLDNIEEYDYVSYHWYRR